MGFRSRDPNHGLPNFLKMLLLGTRPVVKIDKRFPKVEKSGIGGFGGAFTEYSLMGGCFDT